MSDKRGRQVELSRRRPVPISRAALANCTWQRWRSSPCRPCFWHFGLCMRPSYSGRIKSRSHPIGGPRSRACSRGGGHRLLLFRRRDDARTRATAGMPHDAAGAGTQVLPAQAGEGTWTTAALPGGALSANAPPNSGWRRCRAPIRSLQLGPPMAQAAMLARPKTPSPERRGKRTGRPYVAHHVPASAVTARSTPVRMFARNRR